MILGRTLLRQWCDYHEVLEVSGRGIWSNERPLRKASLHHSLGRQCARIAHGFSALNFRRYEGPSFTSTKGWPAMKNGVLSMTRRESHEKIAQSLTWARSEATTHRWRHEPMTRMQPHIERIFSEDSKKLEAPGIEPGSARPTIHLRSRA